LLYFNTYFSEITWIKFCYACNLSKDKALFKVYLLLFAQELFKSSCHFSFALAEFSMSFGGTQFNLQHHHRTRLLCWWAVLIVRTFFLLPSHSWPPYFVCRPKTSQCWTHVATVRHFCRCTKAALMLDEKK
jgi:hypothetical protein